MERRSALLPFVLLNAVGIVLLAAGWWGASHRASFGLQAPFFTLGAIGVMVAGTGDAIVLFLFRRAVDSRAVVVDALLRDWLDDANV